MTAEPEELYWAWEADEDSFTSWFFSLLSMRVLGKSLNVLRMRFMVLEWEQN
jgi:hypothetical protein